MSVLLMMMTITVSAQQLALKSNLVDDAILVPSLGVEYAVGERSSLQLMATYNPFSIGEHKWKNWTLQPEYRHWPHDAFTGFFWGVNAIAGGFNINKVHVGRLYDRQRQGNLLGAGLSAGYHHILSTRLSVEFVASVDYLHCWYDRYDGTTFEGRRHSNLVLPIGTGVNLVYFIR